MTGAKQPESERCDVLIIGAGQAGLAAAHALQQVGIGFVIVDAGRQLGDSWRSRYSGLTLFTPRYLSSLPGKALQGDLDGYASKDEFADYLVHYAADIGINVRSRMRVLSLKKIGTQFEASFEDGSKLVCRAVIVASGAFQTPRLPILSSRLSAEVVQAHVADVRDVSSVAKGDVIVVGDGASGRDMALALAGSHRVVLAQGRQRGLLPEKILGRSVWWWLKVLGFLKASPQSLMGRRMRRLDLFPARGNDDRALIAAGIELKPRLTGVEGDKAVFADGSTMAAGTVIWATGYGDDWSWIDIEGAKTIEGTVIHDRGISTVAGLFFVGRPWQRNRGSALIFGVGADAQFVARNLLEQLRA